MNANEYLHKAERTLAAAQLLLDNGDVEGACNRAYYAMFDAAHAALLASGVSVPETQTRTHRGLIGAVSEIGPNFPAPAFLFAALGSVARNARPVLSMLA
jgi:uncharacterized protein (UPF0332 family)